MNRLSKNNRLVKGGRQLPKNNSLKVVIGLLCLTLIFITGCSLFPDPKVRGSMQIEERRQKVITKAEEMVQADDSIDIFVYNGNIYINAENIEWVNQLKPTLEQGLQLCKIKKLYEAGKPFKEYMATKLPVGTQIFLSKERRGTMIALVDGRQIYYLPFFPENYTTQQQ